MKSALFLTGLLFLSSAQACHAANWLVERVSGVAWAVAQGREQVRLQPRMSIPEGVTIATDASGRVRLVSDGNAMMVSPNTRAVVVPARRSGETLVV
ncbi:MAG: hypothetical protein V7704_06160 [Aurantimonas endophytica]|uniref:hypothetical protein n=1 Tax=Aurantimonas endophytica TaxID=1522175 RepID=UPI0030038667